MTPLIITAALSLLALDNTPATNPPPTTVAPATVTTPAKSTNPNDDPDKVICKNQPMTGSRFEKRLCMTRADWGEQERRLQEFERHLGESPATHSGGGMSGQ